MSFVRTLSGLEFGDGRTNSPSVVGLAQITPSQF